MHSKVLPINETLKTRTIRNFRINFVPADNLAQLICYDISKHSLRSGPVSCPTLQGLTYCMGAFINKYVLICVSKSSPW